MTQSSEAVPGKVVLEHLLAPGTPWAGPVRKNQVLRLIDVEGQQVELREGHAVFVRAGTEHRFGAYEQLSVLVIFERRAGETGAGSA